MSDFSPLASITSPQSPTTYGIRNAKVDRITPHCVVGEFPAKTVMEWFARPERKASANYIIGKNGEIGGCVPEDTGACTSGSSINDKRAITIECSCGLKSPYEFNPDVFNSLIKLTADYMSRHNKTELIWINDKSKALSFDTGNDKMIITLHRWFQNVECPGSWLIDHMDEYVKRVNQELNKFEIHPNVLYKVQCGAFSKKENAERLRDELRNKGYKDCFIVESHI